MKKLPLSKPIYNLTPFSLLDYPAHSSCIFWYAGCNMRCLYCYNPEIVLGKGQMEFEECERFLHSRKGLLDAVVFSGGECLIHKAVIEQIRAVKKMGFLVKIDTNGSRPNVLETLINEHLIDFVALDFKAPKKEFAAITKSNLFSNFEKSLKILVKSTIKFEVRTTFHSDLLTAENLNEMAEYLAFNGYSANYYIQYFRNNVSTIGNLSASKNKLENELKAIENINFIFR